MRIPLSLVGLRVVPALREVLQHPPAGVVDEHLRGVGQGVFVLDAYSDIPVEPPGQGAAGQRIGALIEHQLLHDADAQPAGHHGQNGLILLHGVLDAGVGAVVVEHGLYLVVVALVQQDQRVFLQCLRREGVAPGQGMVAGHDDLPLIPLQKPAVQVLLRRGGQGNEAAVRLPVEHPVGYLVVEVGGQQLEFNAGILRLKRLEHARQPLFRHAGERGHPHKAGVQPPQVGGVLLQPVLGGAHLLKIRCQGAAVRRGGHAAVTAHQQRHAQLLLQCADGVADAGLGEVQRPRRRRKAAQLHGFEKYLILAYAHGRHLPISLRPLYHDSRSHAKKISWFQ